MAEFCKQCAIEDLGLTEEQYAKAGDFVGLTTETDTNDEIYHYVLCEGCGATTVDHTGACVYTDCLKPNHPTN